MLHFLEFAAGAYIIFLILAGLVPVSLIGILVFSAWRASKRRRF